MPYKAKHPCKNPSCPALIDHGSYCIQHKRYIERAVDQRTNSGERGYSAKWRKVRDKYIAMYPTCALCGARAEHVHHIVPIRYGGTNEFDNLMPLCITCHNRATAKENALIHR